MKSLAICLMVLTIIASNSLSQVKTSDEYIKKAEDHQTSGRIDKAIQIMEAAVAKYPDNSKLYTTLGAMISTKVRKTKDMTVAIKLCSRCFEMWDKALSLDPRNIEARFLRGAWGVNVPMFAGYLEVGINDLEFLIQAFERSPDKAPRDSLIEAYSLLATGYRKAGKQQKAKALWGKIVETAPGTKAAKGAEENIKELALLEARQSQLAKKKKPEGPDIVRLKEKIQKEPANVGLLLELGKLYYIAENYEEAKKIFTKALGIEPSNIQVYKRLVSVLEKIAGEGYDERIYVDTDFRTNLAFELVNLLDKAVALAPEDIDLRLQRGVSGVMMPFFVQKLDQAIDDLLWIGKSNAPDEVKAEALYWLGKAYQKKSMNYWIHVVSKYSKSNALQMVFDEIRPDVKRIDISNVETPAVTVDFVLGFQDELEPQTAVWIEDAHEKFIKTIYVSGFSGYAKQKQVNLPEWAESSDFADVDAVTGASINLGHHIYVWDLKDHSGNRVKPGEYIVKVEVNYWPSGEYQMVSTKIRIGKESDGTVVEEENLIPYLEVKYHAGAGQ